MVYSRGGGGGYSLYFSYTYVRQNVPLFVHLYLAGHLKNGNLLSVCPTNSQVSLINNRPGHRYI